MGGKPSTPCRSCTHHHKHEHYHIYTAQGPSSDFTSSPVYNSPPCTSPASSFNPPNYRTIGDEYNSLEQVSQALKEAGLESSNLIIGIDFTISNKWTGKTSFDGKNLHHLGDCPNPYEQAISIIGKTLSEFDDDNRIPCYGFGDATTVDQQVFSFHPEDKPCNGFADVLSCYRETVPRVRLAGPTSFAPIIRTAIRIVNESGGQYHVLLIIADGQVTRSVDTPLDRLSPQEESTIGAIVEASKYPLSIVLVGVGDGPWDQMYKCDDHIPARDFDNFQFVNFTEIMMKNVASIKKEAEFALKALMEIPSQYKATIALKLLSQRRETRRPLQFPLPSPIGDISSSSSRRGIGGIDLFPYGVAPSSSSESLSRSSSSSTSSSYNRLCRVCFSKEKDLEFGCGHQTCFDCGKALFICPSCDTHITSKFKLKLFRC